MTSSRKLTKRNVLRKPTVFTSPDDYQKLAERIHLFNKSVEAFEKPKQERTSEDYQILREALRKVPFLTENANKNSLDVFLTNCADTMEYEFFQKDSAIFHFGDTGRKFYLILRGSVDIYIPKSQDEIQLEVAELDKETKEASQNLNNFVPVIEEKDEDSKAEPQVIKKESFKPGGLASTKQRKSVVLDAPPVVPRQLSNNPGAAESHSRKVFRTRTNLLMKFGTFSKQMQLNNDLLELFSRFDSRSDLYIQKGVATMKKIRNMGAGSYFGELALSTDKPRSASVIAAEDVHVVTLTKESYKSIFEQSIKAIALKTKFFEAFFDNCGRELVGRIAYVFNERKYDFGQVIYSEGAPANEVFLLRKGEVQLTTSQEDEFRKNRNLQGKLSDAPSIEEFNINSKRSHRVYKQVRLTNILPGSMFGECEILSKTLREATAIAAQECIVFCTTVEEFERLRLRYSSFKQKVLEKHQIKDAYRKKRLEQIKQVNIQAVQKMQAKYLNLSKSGVFRFRDEIIGGLEKPEAHKTAEVTKTVLDEKPLSKITASSQAHSDNLKSTLIVPTKPLSAEKTSIQSPRKEGAVNGLEIISDYLKDKLSDSPELKSNFFGINSYSPAAGRKKFIRGTSSVQEEPGKFFLSNKSSKLTVSDLIDRNMDIHKANQSLVNKPFESWFGDNNKLKKHRRQHQGSSTQSAQKSHRTLARTDSSMQILRPYEREDLQKLFRESKSRQNSLAKGSRPQTSMNSNEFFTTRLDFPSALDFEIKGKSVSCKKAGPNRDLFTLSVSPELTMSGRDNVLKSNANEPYGSYFAQRPLTSGDVTYRSMRVQTEYDEITKEGIAELELAAPWSNKKRKNVSLQLSLNCLKPYYFVESQSKTAHDNPLSHTTGKDNEKSDTSSQTEMLNVMSSNGSNRRLIQSPKTPRSVLSSRHNQFRLQPDKPYITEMHYLAEGMQSEYGLKSNV